MDEVEFYNVKDIAKGLGIGVKGAYKLVKQADFPKITLNRRILVPKKEFTEWKRRHLGTTILL